MLLYYNKNTKLQQFSEELIIKCKDDKNEKNDAPFYFNYFDLWLRH